MSQANSTLYEPLAQCRTVSAIVEHSHALVDDAWCRRLLAGALHALDQHRASATPTPILSADSVSVLDDGSLVQLGVAAQTAEPTEEAGELHALARVLHFAISAEPIPDGPLGPRLLDGYSEQLCKGLDYCLGPNRRLRPQNTAEMRILLGIAPGMPASTAVAEAPVASAAVSESETVPVSDSPSLAAFQMWPTDAPQQRDTRWGLVASSLIALGLAGAILLIYFPEHVPTAYQHLLPKANPVAAPGPTAAPVAPPVNVVLNGTSYELAITPSATVEVDGQVVGSTPALHRISLAPGQHLIRIVHPDAPAYVTSVTAGDAATATISHDFTTPTE